MSDLEMEVKTAIEQEAHGPWGELMYALESLQDALEKVGVIGTGDRGSPRPSRDSDGGSSAPSVATSTDTGQATDPSESAPATVAGSDCHDQEVVAAEYLDDQIPRPDRSGIRDRRHAEPKRRVKRV